MSNFSWKRDRKNIMWAETGLLILVRAVAASLVWIIFIAFQARLPFTQMLVFFGTYVVLFAVLPLLAIVVGLLSEIIPFIGFINFFILLVLLPGDPVVFAVHKVFPGIVPVDSYPFLNFRALTWVLTEVLPDLPDDEVEGKKKPVKKESGTDKHGPRQCPDCNSVKLFGNEGDGKCSACHGSGDSNMPDFIPGQNEGNCYKCKGSGICSTCVGSGIIR
jgi:hypothetical protein